MLPTGIEPTSPGRKPGVLPLDDGSEYSLYRSKKQKVVDVRMMNTLQSKSEVTPSMMLLATAMKRTTLAIASGRRIAWTVKGAANFQDTTAA